MKDINLKDFVSMLSGDDLNEAQAMILDRIDRGELVVVNRGAFLRREEIQIDAQICATQLLTQRGDVESKPLYDENEETLFRNCVTDNLKRMIKYFGLDSYMEDAKWKHRN